MRVNWWGVGLVAAICVVWFLGFYVQTQYETHFVALQTPETRQILNFETVRDLLRWLAFVSVFVFLRCVVLLCTRPPA
jgi:hypothetical protein